MILHFCDVIIPLQTNSKKMAENQKDQRNHQSDSKSHQEQTQDGKKKEETNPNNPTASQNNQRSTRQDSKQKVASGSTEGKQHNQNSTSTKGEDDLDVVDTDENEVESTKKVNSDKSGKRNSQNGSK